MDTLFHYCSSSTFASIVSRKSIWLSSLSLSNDTMEGRLVKHTFEKFLSRSDINASQKEVIKEAIRFVEETFDGLGFCLSEKSDLLSQWRGYADNGQGFSIGFTKEYFEKLAKSIGNNVTGFVLEKVLYEQGEHEAALMPTYDVIKKLSDSGKLNRKQLGLMKVSEYEDDKTREDEYSQTIDAALYRNIVMTYKQRYKLKSKAFSEEAEWRLVSQLLNGSALFRASGNRLIPYREFSLKPLDVKSIVEVYIGPKNISPKSVIKKFLFQNGFPDVSVNYSAASYR